MNTQAFQVVLESFARSSKASQQKHSLLVLDDASWHTRSKLAIPEGIQTVFQPSYSPELQPAGLWQLSDELGAKRTPKDLNELEHRLSLQIESVNFCKKKVS